MRLHYPCPQVLSQLFKYLACNTEKLGAGRGDVAIYYTNNIIVN